MKDIEIGEGRKRVSIIDDGYDLSLNVTRNGWQWTGTAVDTEILIMIMDAIKQYFENSQRLD